MHVENNMVVCRLCSAGPMTLYICRNSHFHGWFHKYMSSLRLRAASLGLPKWRWHVDSLLLEHSLTRIDKFGIERTLLKYEQMERLSLLELAVWKCTIQNDPFFSTLQEIRDQWALNEKFDPAAYANERRVTSGITEIIQNVLPFLGKPWEN